MQRMAKVDQKEEQTFEVDAGIEPMHLHYLAADHKIVWTENVYNDVRV